MSHCIDPPVNPVQPPLLGAIRRSSPTDPNIPELIERNETTLLRRPIRQWLIPSLPLSSPLPLNHPNTPIAWFLRHEMGV
jgi:hypothetical protein